MTTPTKTNKTFDCVGYKRHVQAEIFRTIHGMTHEQEQTYFQEQAERGPLGDWWKRVKTMKCRNNNS